MDSSADDIIETDTTLCLRRIEIRLSRPVPRICYQGGKLLKEPTPDMKRVIAKVQPELIVALQSLYGPETSVVVKLVSAADIRFQGSFEEKAATIKAVVEDLLSNAFDHLELGEG